jgi:WD40-like Beta Propeller Repeat
MTSDDRFGGTVSVWLEQRAGTGAPDYLDDILGRTARTRQRPGWTSIERWPPMDISASRTVLPSRFPVRSIALLAILGLLLVAIAAVIVGGGSAQKAPPLFGPARNGPIIYSQNGDIVRLDPATGMTTTLIAGADTDVAPGYARNGQHITFLRELADGSVAVVIAGTDGSDIRVLTDPLVNQDWGDFSADGTRMALINGIEGQRAITMVATDGSPPRDLDLSADLEPQNAMFRGPDSTQLVFRGVDRSKDTVGIYAIGVDGSDLHPIFETMRGVQGGYQLPITSPDGTKVTYTNFEHDPDTGTGNLVIHVRDLATRADVTIPAPPDPVNPADQFTQGYATFSPDGTLLAFLRFVGSDGYDLVVAPADGSDVGRKIGPTLSRTAQDEGPFREFTPDGLAVLWADMERGVVLKVPVDGSEPSTLPFDGGSMPGIQRLAP